MRSRWRWLPVLVILLALPCSVHAEFVNGDLLLVGSLNYCEDTGSSTTTYACTPTDIRITGYQTGTLYSFKVNTTNTGASTFNFNSLGAKTIKKLASNITTDVVAGDLCAGQRVLLQYDGTNLQMLSPVCNAPPSSTVVRSVYIPAGGMDVEGACALGASAVLVTTGPKVPAITCTDVDTDGIDFEMVMPDGWNAGTITVELVIFYTGTTHDAHVFDMNFSGQCVRNGDAVAAWAITSGATAESSTNVEVQFTATDFTTSGNIELKKASSAITLSGTCAGGAHVYMHGLVDASSTTFTPMTELKILGAKVEYTRNASD